LIGATGGNLFPVRGPHPKGKAARYKENRAGRAARVPLWKQ
jgi:hypothetical protein